MQLQHDGGPIQDVQIVVVDVDVAVVVVVVVAIFAVVIFVVVVFVVAVAGSDSQDFRWIECSGFFQELLLVIVWWR